MTDENRNWLIFILLIFVVVMTIVLSIAWGGGFAYHGPK